jgi:hypothetical protein
MNLLMELGLDKARQPNANGRMIYALPELDDTCDPALRTLLGLWIRQCCDGNPPTRQSFDPFTLKPWLGHISIYEATGTGDFTNRLEGSDIVDMTGENWTTRRASEIDLKYASSLASHLSEAAEAMKPSIHRMQVFQRDFFYVTRLLLPVCKKAGGPAEQVFLAMYKDIVEQND